QATTTTRPDRRATFRSYFSGRAELLLSGAGEVLFCHDLEGFVRGALTAAGREVSVVRSNRRQDARGRCVGAIEQRPHVHTDHCSVFLTRRPATKTSRTSCAVAWNTTLPAASMHGRIAIESAPPSTMMSASFPGRSE